MADQRQLDQVFIYVEHDQGDVERKLDQIFAYVEHDQGDVERKLDWLVAYIEVVEDSDDSGRVFGPALVVMGG